MKKVSIEVLVIRLAVVVVVGELVGVVRVLVEMTLVFAKVITFKDKKKNLINFIIIFEMLRVSSLPKSKSKSYLNIYIL